MSTGAVTAVLPKVLIGVRVPGESGPCASMYILGDHLFLFFLYGITYIIFSNSKHGCDYKGYGFACKLPRLDLTGFAHEAINDRDRPVLQLFCSVCHRQESWQGNVLVRCEGCPKAMHQKCSQGQLTEEFVASDEQWFCDAACHENSRRKRIVVELPRKRLPLMCAPKNNTTTSSSASSSLRSNIYSSSCNSSS
ncbi:hypothetical protein BJV82DRAFT_165146 [Fennellomyces sp. T-0311]|nr:hypothetical protein BJV82DRAFT_165146 [Fennellomyces sp. T-0311]